VLFISETAECILVKFSVRALHDSSSGEINFDLNQSLVTERMGKGGFIPLNLLDTGQAL
jgi:hypothetical protein